MSTPSPEDRTRIDPALPREDETLLREPTPPEAAPTEAIRLPGPPSLRPLDPGGEAPGSISEEAPEDLRRHPRYRLLELLGKGGMGLVFKAEHRLMDRIVALKVIHQHLLSSTSTVERFRREVKAAAQLRHPNIVAAYDAEQAGKTHILVMEFVEGQTLTEVLQARGTLGITEACDQARQVARGLEHAHTLGMIHRDVKPDNLMLSTRGVVKILDFGLARLGQTTVPESDAASLPETSGAGQLTLAGTVMGTPDYLAPEQATDSSKVDIRADVYALGCTLYQLLSGRVPYPGGSTTDKLLRHLTEEPTPLRSLRPEVPVELAAVVAKMMARDPARRYQTPTEVIDALTPFAQPRRKRRWPLVAALTLPLLVAVGVLAFLRPGSRNQTGYLVVSSPVLGVEVLASGDDGDSPIRLEEAEQPFALPPGTYTLALVPPRADLRLAPVTIEIQPGRRTRAEILRIRPADDNAWRKVPLPDPARLAALASPLDQLPPYLPVREIPDPWRLPNGFSLAVLLGTPRFPLVGLSAFLSFAREGDPIAVPSGNDVLLFRTTTGRVSRVIRGHTGRVLRAELSPDARWLLTASLDRTARLWATASGEELERWTFPQNPWGGQFCPRGQLLGVTSVDGTVIVYDRVAGRERVNVKLDQQITGLTFHPTGEVVAIGLGSGAVGFVDLTGTRAEPLHRSDALPVRVPAKGPHVVVAFDAGGTRLAVASDLEVKVGDFRLEGLQVQPRWSIEGGGVGLLAFTPDGTRLLATAHHHQDPSKPHLVSVLDAASGKKLSSIFMKPRGQWGSYALSPDGNWLAGTALEADNELTIYDLKTGRYVARPSRHLGPVRTVAFSPDGRFLVSGGKDGLIKVWDTSQGTWLREWSGSESEVRDLAIAPDGRRVACAARDEAVRLFRFPEGNLLLEKPHPSGAEKVAFTRDGKRLMAAGLDATVHLFDPDTGLSGETFSASGKPLTALACDLSDRVIAAGSDKGFIQVWQRGRTRALHLLTAHEQGVASLVRSPDNRWLYSTGDNTLRVWNFEKGTLHSSLPGLEGFGRALACSPDGRLLAIGGMGGWLIMGDLTGVRPRWHRLRVGGRVGEIGSLAFSPEGRYLACGTSEGTVHLVRLARRGALPQLPKESPDQLEEGTIQLTGNQELPFGDPTWGDYTLEAEVMPTQGNGEVGLMFRHVAPGNWTALILGGWNNTFHGFLAARPGSKTLLAMRLASGGTGLPGKTELNVWNKVRVEVRGNTARAWLDGRSLIETSDVSQKAGVVGLRVQATTAVFRRIRVTDVSGKVLFQGVPDRK